MPTVSFIDHCLLPQENTSSPSDWVREIENCYVTNLFLSGAFECLSERSHLTFSGDFSILPVSLYHGLHGFFVMAQHTYLHFPRPPIGLVICDEEAQAQICKQIKRRRMFKAL